MDPESPYKPGDPTESFTYFNPDRRPVNRVMDSLSPVSVYSLDGSAMNVINPRPKYWKELDTAVLKYVDDFGACEKLALVNAYNIFSTSKPQSVLHAKESENFFNTVKARAERIGMRVNDRMTQILCVSTAVDTHVSSYIRLRSGEKIHSQENLRILGFNFWRTQD